MELLWGGGCLVALYWVVCVIGHGYANTVDSIALFLHQHAERIKRMHSARDSQIRHRWLAEGRRMKNATERRPVSVHESGGFREGATLPRLAPVETVKRKLLRSK